MELHGNNIIAGELARGDGSAHRATDPTLVIEIDPPFTAASAAQIDQAVSAADEAFDQYRALSDAQVGDFLDRIGEEILALGDALVERATQETALPTARITMERGRTVGQLKMFANLVRDGSYIDARIDTAIPDRQPLPKPDLRSVLMPIGPIVVFAASNFPLAFSVAGGDTASALAAGCPVVFKAHRAHPGTSELVATAIGRAVQACDMPAGVFSLIHGGHDVGQALVQHPLTRAVGFTGSQRGGRALFDLAAARAEPIPVYAEMGSLNPVFVLPGALDERAEALADGFVPSLTLGVGQFCTNPGLVFGLDDDKLDRFVSRTSALVEQAAPGTMLTAGICEAYHEGSSGVESLSGVAVAARTGTDVDRGKTQSPAIVFETSGATFLKEPQLSEEMFGPASVVVRCKSKAQIEKIARNLEGHLTGTIHGTNEDLHEYAALVRILERKVGRLIFNAFPTGVEVCPSMHHGGPYPAATDVHFTSVGTAAIKRFQRPIAYQGFPDDALPTALRNANAGGIWRTVNGNVSRECAS